MNDVHGKNLKTMADALKTESAYERSRNEPWPWRIRLDRLQAIQAYSIDDFNDINKGFLKTIACSRFTFIKENSLLYSIITGNRLLVQVKCD